MKPQLMVFFVHIYIYVSLPTQMSTNQIPLNLHARARWFQYLSRFVFLILNRWLSCHTANIITDYIIHSASILWLYYMLGRCGGLISVWFIYSWDWKFRWLIRWFDRLNEWRNLGVSLFRQIKKINHCFRCCRVSQHLK